MTNNDELDRVVAWFRARLPEEWTPGEAEITVDREEITVLLRIADPELGPDDGPDVVAEARSGRAAAFREDTRQRRMTIADQASRRFGRTVSWGAVVGHAADDDHQPHRELWTHVAAPVMTRLRQPQRIVLDTLVEAGVARSRADALAWCVRLVGQHEGDWLEELRSAMTGVQEVRRRGPSA
jgi:hypothetical protein